MAINFLNDITKRCHISCLRMNTKTTFKGMSRVNKVPYENRERGLNVSIKDKAFPICTND